MTPEICRQVAARQDDCTLLHTARAINADLAAHIASGQPSTRAHFGLIELAQACTDELSARGYVAGHKADGSDLPVDVWYETVCGVTTRLSFGVRCF